jgi:hypothetical protein
LSGRGREPLGCRARAYRSSWQWRSSPETTVDATRLLPSVAGGMRVPVTVSQLSIAPVKGMRLQCTGEVQLGHHGVTGDREFLVIGDDCKLLLTSRTPALLQIEPTWDRVRNVLTLGFPDGEVVHHTPEPGAHATTRMYDGRVIPGSSPRRSAPRCPATLARPCTCSNGRRSTSVTMTSP